MASVKARVLETVIEHFHSPVVAGLSYRIKHSKLIIYYHSAGNGDIDYKIIFENPRGFRLLDEGDMYNYWEGEEMRNNWLFEIESGGWLDRENDAGVFLSKILEYREFLITGVDDCVSVICGNEPIIMKYDE